MTVKELIEKLEQFDGETYVLLNTPSEELFDIRTAEFVYCEEGEELDEEFDDITDATKVVALRIMR